MQWDSGYEFGQAVLGYVLSLPLASYTIWKIYLISGDLSFILCRYLLLMISVNELQ